MSVSWQCKFCTYLHKVPSAKCVMCEKPCEPLHPNLPPNQTNPYINHRNFASDESSPGNQIQRIPVNRVNASNIINQANNKVTNSTLNSVSSPNLTNTKRVINNPYAKQKSTTLSQPEPASVGINGTDSNTNNGAGNSDLIRNSKWKPPLQQQEQKRQTFINYNGSLESSVKAIESADSSTAQQQQQQQQQQNTCMQNQPQHHEQLSQHSPPKPLDKSKLKSIKTATNIPICPDTSKTWVYPNHPDFPVRKYQLDITRKALFHNTLVSLPTGLGKTLIAAVVMYNYYRWYGAGAKETPSNDLNGKQGTGKIVFCAPTRPLVAQQVEACYNIVNIPHHHIVQISGETAPVKRESLWNGSSSKAEACLYFCTPQTLMEDIKHKRCPAEKIVCIVFDEAHKAKGEYAYVQVINKLQELGAVYRVLGLSATPGTNIQNIQQVIDNLKIEEIQVRLESDPDVKPYVHEKEWEIKVVKQSDAMKGLEKLANRLIQPILERLSARNALEANNHTNLTPYMVLKARKDYQQASNDHTLNGHFYALQNIVRWRNDLKGHGAMMVKDKIRRMKEFKEFNDENQIKKAKGALADTFRSNDFKIFWESLSNATSLSQTQLSPSNTLSQHKKKQLQKHNPKLEELCKILTEHFERAQVVNESSRAIVFSQWRDSVEEIVNVLATQPLLKPRKFIGQGRATIENSVSSKNGKKRGRKKNESESGPLFNSLVPSRAPTGAGMKQKEQQKVIEDFKTGVHNVIVCTSIGEEGLDIGEVDLIVNFDCLRSPIRMIQRTGRTGRKRKGRVICLVSEGQEQQRLNSSTHATKYLGRALKNISSFNLAKIPQMFTMLPVMEMKEIQPSEEFRFSQIGGHTPSKDRRRNRKGNKDERGYTESSIFNSNSWKLTSEQEKKRLELFGELPLSRFTSLSNIESRMKKEFPQILRRKLTKIYVRNVISRVQSNQLLQYNKQHELRSRKLVDEGQTKHILRIMEERLMTSNMIGSSSSYQSPFKTKGWKNSEIPSVKEKTNDVTKQIHEKTSKEKGKSDTFEKNALSTNQQISAFHPFSNNLNDIFGCRRNATSASDFESSSFFKQNSTQGQLDFRELFDHIDPSRTKVKAPIVACSIFTPEGQNKNDFFYNADQSSSSSDESVDSWNESTCHVTDVEKRLDFETESSEYICDKGEDVMYDNDTENDDAICAMFDNEEFISPKKDHFDSFPQTETTCINNQSAIVSTKQREVASIDTTKQMQVKSTFEDDPHNVFNCLSPDQSQKEESNGVIATVLKNSSDLATSKSDFYEKYDETTKNDVEKNDTRDAVPLVVNSERNCEPQEPEILISFDEAHLDAKSQTFYLPTPPESSSSSSSEDEDNSSRDKDEISDLQQKLTCNNLDSEVIQHSDKKQIVEELKDDKSNYQNKQLSSNVMKESTKSTQSAQSVMKEIESMKVDLCSSENIEEVQKSYFEVDHDDSDGDEILQRNDFSIYLPTQESHSSSSSSSDDDDDDEENVGKKEGVKKDLADISTRCDSPSCVEVLSSRSIHSQSNEYVEPSSTEKHSIQNAAIDKTIADQSNMLSHSIVSSEDKDGGTPRLEKNRYNPSDESPVIFHQSNRMKRKLNILLSDTPTPNSKVKKSSNDFFDSPASSHRVNMNNLLHSMNVNNEDDAIVCAICGYPDSPSDDPIVFCDGPKNDNSCTITVHKSCYGITSSIDDIEFWRCDPCEERHQFLLQMEESHLPRREEKLRPRCRLCNKEGGALKKTPHPENYWVHPFCMFFSPGYTAYYQQHFNSTTGGFQPTIVKFSDLSSIAGFSANRMQCSFCSSNCDLSCAVPNCSLAAHPNCAMLAEQTKGKWTLLRYQNKHTSQQKWEMFCPMHNDSAQGIMKEHLSITMKDKQQDISGYYDLCEKKFLCLSGLCDLSLSSEVGDNVIDVTRKRLKKKFNDRSALAIDVDEHTRQQEKQRRIEARIQKRQRAMLNNKFLDVEAGIETDEDIDGDVDEDKSIMRIEEEEKLSNDSFINDTSQLGHSSQDSLEVAEKIIADGNLHRELDGIRALSTPLSTPILNRRMKKKKIHIDWESPSTTPGSGTLKGLGNMNFIRSVIEHHRKGGQATELEKEYHMLAEHGTQYAVDEEFYNNIQNSGASPITTNMTENQSIVEIPEPYENEPELTSSEEPLVEKSESLNIGANTEFSVSAAKNLSSNYPVKNPYIRTQRKKFTSSQTSQIKNVQSNRLPTNDHLKTNTAKITASTLTESQKAMIEAKRKEALQRRLTESQKAMIEAKRKEALLRRQQISQLQNNFSIP